MRLSKHQAESVFPLSFQIPEASGIMIDEKATSRTNREKNSSLPDHIPMH
jgi:hypothetical protein